MAMTRRSCCTRGVRLRAGVVITGCLLLGSTAGAEGVQLIDSSRPRSAGNVRTLPTEARSGQVDLQRATTRSDQGLSPERRADGTLKLDLEGRYQHVHYAIPDGAGGVTVGCTDDLAKIRPAGTENH